MALLEIFTRVYFYFSTAYSWLDPYYSYVGKSGYKLVFNQYGARGHIYKGQTHKIAINCGNFGTGSYLIPQDRNWPVLLESKLKDVHVDNYSLMWNYQRYWDATYSRINWLQRRQIQYDLYLICLSYYNLPVHPEKIIKNLKQVDPFNFNTLMMRSLFRDKLIHLKNKEKIRNKEQDYHSNYFSWKRKKDKAFIDEDVVISPAKKKDTAAYVKVLVKKARKVAKNVVIVIAPIGASDNEPHVYRKSWKFLEKSQSGEFYLTRKSVLQKWNKHSDLYYAIAKQENIPVIDLRPVGQKLAEEGNINYFNPRYLTETGIGKILKVIYDNIKLMMEDN